MYDIVFISYQESNAEKNWKLLTDRFPMAKRVHGVTGIHQAHKTAANKCFTKMFWVVDADAKIKDNFNFDYEVSEWDLDTVHVWRSENPINRLEYGYGGIKLLPRRLTMNLDVTTTDMTTSISNKFKSIEFVSNITEFNTDPYSTWRSAFRECVKLSSKVISGQVGDETKNRLDIWCTIGESEPYGKWALLGAHDGRQYGTDNSSNPDNLSLINDFEWLQERFNKQYG